MTPAFRVLQRDVIYLLNPSWRCKWTRSLGRGDKETSGNLKVLAGKSGSFLQLHSLK